MMSTDRLVILLGILLMSSSMLIGIADADKYRYDGDEDTCSSPEEEWSTAEECHRECREGEPPKICYYSFTLEYYTVQGAACQRCSPNDTNILSDTCQCVPADGMERSIMTVNRKLPGPSIQVCLGDKIVVDLINRIDGTGISIHWHGILQKGSQYYDGVPFLTQCPISFGNNFRYQFDADNEGTHFWHSHAGFAKMDGILGSLIVRVPPLTDPNKKLYDYDLFNHVVMCMDWNHELTSEHFPGLRSRNRGQLPDNLLINGRGTFQDQNTGEWTNASLAVFHVKSGYSYRFRFINAFCSVCIGELAIQGHRMTLIATDGIPVKPVKVDTINSLAGERFDVVLNADQRPGCYYMVLRAIGPCASLKIIQYALICYINGRQKPVLKKPTYDSPLSRGVLLGPLDGLCEVRRKNNICINQLRSARPVSKNMLAENADETFYFDIDLWDYSVEQLYRPGYYERFSVPQGTGGHRSRVNSISFVFPPSPPLSQPDDVPQDQYCDKDNHPANCGTPCACTQLYHVKTGSIVQIVLSDAAGSGLSHPIHMHGYAFNVMGMGVYPNRTVTKMNAHHTRYLNSRHLLCTNYDHPPYKDTIAIPIGGYVVLRFCADNPGYWLMHCHFLFHQLIGMEFIIHVGDRDDLPPVPKGFPKCGNFRPPLAEDYTSPKEYPYGSST